MLFQRNRLRRRGPLPFRYIFLLTFVFFIIFTTLGLWIVDRRIEPTLIAIAENESERVATLVIQKAINKQIAEDEIDVADLIEIEKDESGVIASVNFDAAIINRIKSKITNLVQLNLKIAEDGELSKLELSEVDIKTDGPPKDEGIIYEIPLGQATNNALLGNLGPKVPVRFFMIGDVVTDVKSTIRQYGINNAILEIDIIVNVNVQVVIPFATKIVRVNNRIPIAIQSIQGKVPNFYNNGGNANPSIQIPVPGQ